MARGAAAKRTGAPKKSAALGPGKADVSSAATASALAHAPMMAGGNDGTDKAARTLARRPTIRPRAVTPPRTPAPPTATAPVTKTPAWTLPPVRLPSPRVTEASRMLSAAARPALLLVADASDQFEIALRHDDHVTASALRTTWRAPRTTALAAVTVVLLAVAAVVVVWASARPNEQLQTSAVPARATSTAIAPATHAAAVTKTEEPTAPSIPVFDVKSLPPASRGR